MTSPILPDLQQALSQVINKTVEGAQAGLHFLQEQLPDVIHQLLMWNAVKDGVLCVVWLISAGLLCWLTARCIKAGIRDDEEIMYMVSIIPGIVAGTLAVIGFAYGLEFLEIVVAPKIFLIEYAAHLAGK